MKIGDVPIVVDNEVKLQLPNYHVPIYTMVPDNRPPFINPVGSGTLVEVEGNYSILTAAHVWNKIKNYSEIGLGLTDHNSQFTIDREAISAKKIPSSGNDDPNEWGPDLALLQLKPSDVSTIERYKSFLNLAQQKTNFHETTPPAVGKGFWAFIGMVGESSDIDSSPGRHTTTIHNRVFFSCICNTPEHDGYDFIDLSANLELPEVPSSFVGVSGGGLWEIGLSRKTGEITWDEKRLFRGVAFWETPISDGRRMIRFHGPRSIFERAWELWELP